MTARCELCGEPMPAGEDMFKYHGYSGPCPKPPQQKTQVMADAPLTYEQIYRNLDGLTALAVAERTTMGKTKGERDTEFVKRIVATYMLVAQGDPMVRASG